MPSLKYYCGTSLGGKLLLKTNKSNDIYGRISAFGQNGKIREERQPILTGGILGKFHAHTHTRSRYSSNTKKNLATIIPSPITVLNKALPKLEQ